MYLGGGSYGSVLTWTEAMLTVTELAEMTHRCSSVVDISVQAVRQAYESLLKDHTVALAPDDISTIET